MSEAQYLRPDWPAPAGVQAVFTLRAGGVSQGPWASFNLATHVGDDPCHVTENRAQLMRGLALPRAPVWLEQVHGVRTVCLDSDPADGEPADAAWTSRAGPVCAVMVADCLPVLLCDTTGQHVAAAHAGWRGLCAGVLESTLQALRQAAPSARWMAWLGPCIGPSAYEVGSEVRNDFLAQDGDAGRAFVPTRPGHWHADLQALARQRLKRAGVTRIFAEPACTFSDPRRFYSFRRDGVCGRMAALIWRD